MSKMESKLETGIRVLMSGGSQYTQEVLRDALARILSLESDLAFYKRGIEAYRGNVRWHARCVPGTEPFHCEVCAWEAEAKKREVE